MAPACFPSAPSQPPGSRLDRRATLALFYFGIGASPGWTTRGSRRRKRGACLADGPRIDLNRIRITEAFLGAASVRWQAM